MTYNVLNLVLHCIIIFPGHILSQYLEIVIFLCLFTDADIRWLGRWQHFLGWKWVEEAGWVSGRTVGWVQRGRHDESSDIGFVKGCCHQMVVLHFLIVLFHRNFAVLLITHADSNRKSIATSQVYLWFYLCVCLRDNSKMNDHKLFTLYVGNDCGISYKRYGFGVKRSKVRVRVANTYWYSLYRRSSGRGEFAQWRVMLNDNVW